MAHAIAEDKPGTVGGVTNQPKVNDSSTSSYNRWEHGRLQAVHVRYEAMLMQGRRQLQQDVLGWGLHRWHVEH